MRSLSQTTAANLPGQEPCLPLWVLWCMPLTDKLTRPPCVQSRRFGSTSGQRSTSCCCERRAVLCCAVLSCGRAHVGFGILRLVPLWPAQHRCLAVIAWPEASWLSDN
jgi:hypothetical protein